MDTDYKNNLLLAIGLFQKTKEFHFNIDNPKTANPHHLIAGGSGTGKTTLLKEIIWDLKKKNKTVVVIDFHGDMQTDNENLISFTPTNSKNGINPFELELDPEKGGVNIQAESVTLMLGTYFFDKGRISKKQENMLEVIILSTYAAKGIFQDDFETWSKPAPTMEDFKRTFVYIINHGAEDKAAEEDNPIKHSFDRIKNAIKDAALKKEQSYINSLNDIYKELLSSSNSEDDKDSKDADDYFDYSAINMNYFSTKAMMKSVENIYAYIEKISKMSIFKGEKPKLIKGINRLDLSAFTSISKPLTAKFIGEFISQKFFRACMLRGEYDRLASREPNTKCDRVLIFDESKLALPTGIEKENPFNPFNRIVSESRKYGLALILASQRLNHYSEEILSNMHTKILLGTKSNDYKNAARVMAVKEEVVRNVFSVPNKRTALIEIGGKCDSYEMQTLGRK